MKCSLRVLVLGDSRSMHLARFVPELERQGCTALLASVESGSTPHTQLASKFGSILPSYLGAVAPLRKLIDQWKPDLINPHFISGYGFLASTAAAHRSLPIVSHLWGSDILIVPHKSPLHRWKVAKALRASRHLIADSSYLLAAAEQISPCNAGSVIPWGLERSFFDLYREMTGQSQPVRVIMNRPHEPVYDTLTAARALRQSIASGIIQLSVPARGRMLSAFQSQMNGLPESHLHYYDIPNRHEFLTFVAAHDIYLSASVSDSSPASMIEALGLGLQVIVADIPGVREWSSQSRASLFIAGDENSLLSSLIRLIENRYLWETNAAINRAAVAAGGIFEDNIAATIALFRAACGKSA